jgi:hypothetical protein
MHRDLDDLIAEAREATAPEADATERARRAVRAATPRGRWVRRLGSRRGRYGALGLAALVLGGGAAAAVVGITGRGEGGPPFRPALENCFALEGYSLRTPRLHPQIAVDRSGNATAAWVGLDGVVRASDRPAGGEWEEPAELSTPGRRPPLRVGFSANSAGQAAAVWLQDDRFWVVERPVGQGWGTPIDLTRRGQVALPQGSDEPSVLVTEAGEVVVAWTSVASSAVGRQGGHVVSVAGGPHIETAARPARALWRRARPTQGDSGPVFAEQAAGRVAAAYLAGFNGVAVAELDPRRGTLGGRRVLRFPRAPGRSVSIESPRIAGNGRGALAVTAAVNGRIALWSRGARGGWGPGRLVSPAGLESRDPDVAVSSDGETLIAWTGLTRDRRANGTLRRVRAIYASLPGGAVGAPPQVIRLSREGRVATGASVALRGAGIGVVVWADGTNGVSGTDSRVEAAWLSGDGRGFGEAQPLSSVGTGPLFPDVGMNERGETAATWTRCRRADTAEVEAAEAAQAGGAWSGARLVVP